MILVFGLSGQVGAALARQDGTLCLGRDRADLSDPDTCVAAIDANAPDAVINAAAYTAVDAAEDDEAAAFRINADAPAAMARICADLGVPFVHISTDYVFDGGGDSPRAPDAPTAPLNAYGRSKLAGERAIRDACGPHAVLRTSWVFSATGSNFLKTMLRLSQSHASLRIVEDQIGGPTPADALADACLTMADALRADPGLSGTYHLTGAPDVSWADFARAIFAEAGRDTAVTGIPTAEYPTPAARPLNSRLDCASTEAAFGIQRPDWRGALPGILKEIT